MKITSSDHGALLRLASILPKGDENRRAILSGLQKLSKIQKDIDENKPILMSGLKGVKSTPGTKKFKNMAAFDKWSESEDAGNWTVQSIENA